MSAITSTFAGHSASSFNWTLTNTTTVQSLNPGYQWWEVRFTVNDGDATAGETLDVFITWGGVIAAPGAISQSGVTVPAGQGASEVNGNYQAKIIPAKTINFSGKDTIGFAGHDEGTLTIVKSADVTEVAHGGTVNYTFDVTYTPGADGSPADNIVVSDPQPGLSVISETLGGANPSTNIGDSDGDGLLDGGETWEYTASLTVAAAHDNAEEDPIKNIASVTGQDLDGDPVTGDDSDEVSVDILHNISGRVFEDVDNDGAFELGDGDVGIENVTVQLVDQSTNLVVATTTTNSNGEYTFEAVSPGTYTIKEVLNESTLGLLDGNETAGTPTNGLVDNLQDNNKITDIIFGESDPDLEGYDFAEIEPSHLFGTVWEDFNNDGDINFGETGIGGVAVTLTGTDDRGNAVNLAAETMASGGYIFADLRPGTYSLAETQPAGYDDGVEGNDFAVTNPYAVNAAAISSGTNSGNDVFSGVTLAPGSTGDFYNFGERPQASGAIGEGGGGVTATIGFWHNKNGQTLIRSLNGGETATQLGNWLAATFPNMYGDGAYYDAAKGDDQDMNLEGRTNDEIADIFKYLHQRNNKSAVAGGPAKVDAQVMAVALAMYSTCEAVAGGDVAADYGFNTSANGIGYTTFNVLDVLSASEADDLGLTPLMDGAGNVTIIDILQSTDSLTSEGLLYDYLTPGAEDGDGTISSFELKLRKLANDLYTAINEGTDR
jgi:hypothetical protein